MNHRQLAPTYALIALVAGSAILLHQIIVWQRIDTADILHHEWFSGVLLAFAFGIIFVVGWKPILRRTS